MSETGHFRMARRRTLQTRKGSGRGLSAEERPHGLPDRGRPVGAPDCCRGTVQDLGGAAPIQRMPPPRRPVSAGTCRNLVPDHNRGLVLARRRHFPVTPLVGRLSESTPSFPHEDRHKWRAAVDAMACGQTSAKARQHSGCAVIRELDLVASTGWIVSGCAVNQELL